MLPVYSTADGPCIPDEIGIYGPDDNVTTIVYKIFDGPEASISVTGYYDSEENKKIIETWSDNWCKKIIADKAKK